MPKMSIHIEPNNKSPIILLFFFLVFICYTIPITADPLYSICKSPNYTLNSTFDFNLKQLLQSLPSNTIPGFYNTSIAVDSEDPIYGLGLCRGDITTVDCRKCIQDATLGVLRNCPNSKDATVFYELCEVRYSYQNFFSSMVYTGKNLNWTTIKQDILDQEQFTVVLMDLLKNISSRAAFDPSDSKFAVGETSLTRTESLYGLAQCTKDISRDDCSACLRRSIEDIVGCCSTYKAGLIFSNSCNIRYEVYRFYRVIQLTEPLPTPSSESRRRRRRRKRKGKSTKIGTITTASIVAVLAFVASCLYCSRRRKGTLRDVEIGKDDRELLNDLKSPTPSQLNQQNKQIQDEKGDLDRSILSLMDLSVIKLATDDFSDAHKLGEGRFGKVYKGLLKDGTKIAVKRLPRKSTQGLEEFKNETILISSVQHRNLVRLLGCTIEDEEKLLIYELMPSLDLFVFDQTRRSELNWKTRFNIITGIAHGLLFLHEGSSHKIIHKNLKPNNVLLDHEMNAKISDFRMVTDFEDNTSQTNTEVLVGTSGYMAPEYAMEGLFSMSSDVYSFGVVLLEILSGKQNDSFYLTEYSQGLLNYAWHQRNDGNSLNFIDSLLIESCKVEEVLRCLHVGLLCVQDEVADRPTMSSVLAMLESDDTTDLPQPKQPVFSKERQESQK